MMVHIVFFCLLPLLLVIQTVQTEDKNKSGDGGKKDSFEQFHSKDNSKGNSFQQFHLDAHNKYRKVHNAPSMTLNSKMSEEAEEYAKKIARLGTLKHAAAEERNGQGENLAFQCKFGEAKDDFATKNWYDEVCNPGYDFKNGGFSGGTGHFTQLVWKASTKFGIGKAISKEYGMTCVYVVARYSPAGNMMGDFKKNVLKGSFEKSNYCNTV